MKKLFLSLLCMVVVLASFAQATPGAAEKNAANAALKAKNYAEAFTKLEAYLKVVEFKDKAYLYNTAFVASKLKNYTAAEKYFEMAVKERYKASSSYIGLIKAQQAQGKTAEMEASLTKGLAAYKGNSSLEKIFAAHYMKKAQAAEKSKKLTVAEAEYSKVAKLVSNQFKAQANASLANMFYNSGAEILAKVNPLINTDKPKYEAGKAKAKQVFAKASSYILKAIAAAPSNKQAKDLKAKIMTELSK